MRIVYYMTIRPDHLRRQIKIKFPIWVGLGELVLNFKFPDNQSRSCGDPGSLSVTFCHYFGWSLIQQLYYRINPWLWCCYVTAKSKFMPKSGEAVLLGITFWWKDLVPGFSLILRNRDQFHGSLTT